jgi:hypothetical protein
LQVQTDDSAIITYKLTAKSKVVIMQTESLNRWLSLAANIGVILGLMMVAFQIRQDVELTKVQLFSDATSSRKEWNQAMLGSDPMIVVMKSIENPLDLTLAELHVMDAYLVGAVNELRRLEMLEAAGLSVNVEVEGLHHFFFGSKFAKAWYEEFRDPDYLPYYYDEQIRAMDDTWIEGFFQRVNARLARDQR